MTTIPTYNGQPGRTVSNDYAVNGNPLVTSTTDPNGTITVENDLLGRNVKYTDVRGDVTTSIYDIKGRLVTRASKLGNEEYVYDQFDRLTQQKLDNVTYATVSYDQYSRISNVAYQNDSSLSSIGCDTLGRVNNLAYGINGQTLSDQVVRATTGDIVSGTELGQSKSYDYDGAGRLTNATVAGNTYTYGYGAQNVSCATGTNANSGKSSNRTSQTINGVSTTYCYNNGDQLVSSSDPTINNAAYDSHGNTTSLGSSGNVTSFTYDSSDRLSNMGEASKDIAVSYVRDAQGRVISRSETKNTNIQTALYGYTASGDTPDYLTDGAGIVTEKYLTLPGNVTLTIRPQSQSAGAQTWSLPNIHGDNFATVNADGGLVNTTVTGPFGEAIAGQAALNNLAGSASYGYVGQHQKQTETGFTLRPMDMGARTYIPALGRFLQMDPVKGGTPNDYVYPGDPVNDRDLTGTIGWKKWTKDRYKNYMSFVRKRDAFYERNPWVLNGLMILSAGRGGGKNIRPTRAGGINPLANNGVAARTAAAKLGYTQRIPPQNLKGITHGKAGYSNGKNYITPDATSHKGGVWKMYNKKNERLGTYDANLNRIGN